MRRSRQDREATGPLEIEIPAVPVAVIDGLLRDLAGRQMVSAADVRDMLLDVRNVVWKPAPTSLAGLGRLAGLQLIPAEARSAPEPVDPPAALPERL